MAKQSEARKVRDLIDGEGLYLSRAAAGGGYVFLSTPPVDDTGAFAEEARVKPPYHLSGSARVRAETTYIYQRYKDALAGFGASMDDVLQVEQFIPRKSYADAYAQTSRGKGFLERNRPGSGLMQMGACFPPGVDLAAMAMAVVPEAERAKETRDKGLQYLPPPTTSTGEIWQGGTAASPIVIAGPYCFTTLVATDYREDVDPMDKRGVHPDVLVDEWSPWGSELRNEMTWTIEERLRPRLAVGDTSPEHTVHVSMYLTEIEDLYDLDVVWRETWPEDPPARTVIPVHGHGLPRWEGVKAHADWAMKMESLFQVLRPGLGAEREVVSTGTPQLGHESEAVRGGPLLWVSGQMAADRGGLVTPPHIGAELRHIFGRLSDICEAGGTELANVLLLRAFVTNVQDGYAVYAALREWIPHDPPAVCVNEVPGPLQVPGASVIVDAVVYVP